MASLLFAGWHATHRQGIIVAVLLLGVVACGGGSRNDNNNSSLCVAGADDDGDRITNADEGCASEQDTDGDGVADYLDPDSDNDGVPDRVEAGDDDLATAPPDFDGDGLPDFRDRDSDGDGVEDGDEDRNGDGQVGVCVSHCDVEAPEQCGPGQACLPTGVCEPPITFECAAGESDRLNPDSDGDGKIDAFEGLRVCNAPSESNPEGRRVLQVVRDDVFQLAVWGEAEVQAQSIVNIGPESCGNGVDDDANGDVDCDDAACRDTGLCGGFSVAVDLPDEAGPLAGFALARQARGASVAWESLGVAQAVTSLFDQATVILDATGVQGVSHDGHPMVLNVRLAVAIDSAAAPISPAAVRNQLIVALLERSTAEVLHLPTQTETPLGQPVRNLMISWAVQHRPGPDGTPRAVILGGVASAEDYLDLTRHTGVRLDDFALGSAVGGPEERLTPWCEAHLLSPKPSADIIWVIDDSASMLEERVNVANGAITFFDHALASGYDFRMGVVNVGYSGNGVFCTGTDESNDYFLTDQHVSRFQQCVYEPWGAGAPSLSSEWGISQGYHAIVNHLPRANAPNRIRPYAQLVLIYLSDQRAYELTINCHLDGYTYYEEVDPACLASVIGPTIELLTGVSNPEGVGRAYAIVAPVPWCCDTAFESGQGYVEVVEATGGFSDTICADDLTPALERIAADIITLADPLTLNRRPIALSLGLALDDVALPRSRSDGFDYRHDNGSLAFVNQDFDPERFSEVVVSYQTWAPDPGQPE